MGIVESFNKSVMVAKPTGRDRITRPFHLHAEYCEGPFYMGWWLYIDPVFDGRSVYCRSGPIAVQSRWIHGEFSGDGKFWEDVSGFAKRQMPRWDRYSDRFAEAFGTIWPHGILIDSVAANVFELDWSTARAADASVREGWPNFHLERSIAACPAALGHEHATSMSDLVNSVMSLAAEVERLKRAAS